MERFGTRWFELSRTELRVLLTAVCVVLLGCIAVRIARWAAWEPELKLQGEEKTIQMPARLDVNTAREDELMLLPGVGPVLAAEIVRYRDEHGPYRSLEELTNVRGIGSKTIERLRPYLMCRPPGANP